MLVIFYYSLCQAVVEPADGVDMVYLRSVICDGGKKGGRVKIWKRNHSIDVRCSFSDFSTGYFLVSRNLGDGRTNSYSIVYVEVVDLGDGRTDSYR